MIPRKLVQALNYSTRGLIDPPLLSLVLELTNKCNLNCKICHARKAEQQGYMPLELIKRLLDEASSFSYPLKVGLSYRGEPLLHPDIDTILDYARSKKNLILSLNTNGLLLHKHNLEGVTVKLSDHSRDSSKWRPPEDLSQVDEVVIVSPYEGLWKRVQYWLKLGKHVSITPYGEDLQPEFSIWANYEQQYCFWPFEATHIFYNGNVALCCHDMKGETVVQNIGDRSLKELWRGEQYKTCRRNALESKVPLLSCRSCFYWRFRNFNKQVYP